MKILIWTSLVIITVAANVAVWIVAWNNHRRRKQLIATVLARKNFIAVCHTPIQDEPWTVNKGYAGVDEFVLERQTAYKYGLCLCGKPLVPGHSRCAQCLDAANRQEP